MFDYPFEEKTILSALSCVLMYICILYTNYHRGVFPNFSFTDIGKRFKKSQIIIIGLFIIVYSVGGDFFHFYETIKNYDFTPGAYNYGEPIYGILAKLTNRNYLLVRIIVWGGAYILYCKTAQNFGIPVYQAAVILFICYPLTFCYARVTAGMACYFYGLSVIITAKKEFRFIRVLLGVFFILISNLFHNSVIILVLMTPIIFIPFSKRNILIILISLPILVIIAKYYFNSILTSITNYDEGIRAGKLDVYTEAPDNGEIKGIGVLLIETLSYLSFYIPIFVLLWNLFKHKNTKIMAKSAVFITRYLFGIVLASTIFFAFSMSASVLFYRVLYMSMIPICLLICISYNEQLISIKAYKAAVGITCFYSAFRAIYDLYAFLI